MPRLNPATPAARWPTASAASSGSTPPSPGVGLGLAVPINEATRKVIGALMTEGRYRRAWIGIAGGPRPLPPRLAAALEQRGGVEIVEVVADSPAARAGLRAEDLIVVGRRRRSGVELWGPEGSALTGVDDLMREVSGELIGESVRLDVIREGKQRGVDVVPVELVVCTGLWDHKKGSVNL